MTELFRFFARLAAFTVGFARYLSFRKYFGPLQKELVEWRTVAELIEKTKCPPKKCLTILFLWYKNNRVEVRFKNLPLKIIIPDGMTVRECADFLEFRLKRAPLRRRREKLERRDWLPVLQPLPA